MQKAHTLYKLYCYRSFGYEFVREQIEQSSSVLEDDLSLMRQKVKNCHLCPLAKTRKNAVFGEGNENANIMFIGEAPGANEDELGVSFSGRSGELLTNMIQNVLLLKKSDVYITNLVKCRPSNNRVPNIDEVNACKTYILSQIKIINPKIIVTLGPSSFHHLSGKFSDELTNVRGESFEFDNKVLIPTYHPSFLLRNPTAKKAVYQDMLKIKSML